MARRLSPNRTATKVSSHNQSTRTAPRQNPFRRANRFFCVARMDIIHQNMALFALVCSKKSSGKWSSIFTRRAVIAEGKRSENRDSSERSHRRKLHFLSRRRMPESQPFGMQVQSFSPSAIKLVALDGTVESVAMGTVHA